MSFTPSVTCSVNVEGFSDKIQAEKAQYIQALRIHQINTLVELRRIEKVFAVLGTPDCSEPMTSACKQITDKVVWI